MVSDEGLMIPPESGSSSPASILSSVVLPAPFGPHRPTRSPSPICHVTWSMSVRSPKDFVSSESWITILEETPDYQLPTPKYELRSAVCGVGRWRSEVRDAAASRDHAAEAPSAFAAAARTCGT